MDSGEHSPGYPTAGGEHEPLADHVAESGHRYQNAHASAPQERDQAPIRQQSTRESSRKKRAEPLHEVATVATPHIGSDRPSSCFLHLLVLETHPFLRNHMLLQMGEMNFRLSSLFSVQ